MANNEVTLNEARASWANASLTAFKTLTAFKHDDMLLYELLKDLMHWAANRGINFQDELEKASHKYQIEALHDKDMPYDPTFLTY